jgi:acyl carrier protein
MTIEDVIAAVAEETCKPCTADSKIGDLVNDSLEFVELLMIIGEISGKDIPYDAVDEFVTVGDIAAAVS